MVQAITNWKCEESGGEEHFFDKEKTKGKWLKRSTGDMDKRD